MCLAQIQTAHPNSQPLQGDQRATTCMQTVIGSGAAFVPCFTSEVMLV